MFIGGVLRSFASGFLATINLRNPNSSADAAKPAGPAKPSGVILATEAKKSGPRFNNKADYHRYLTQIEFIKQNLKVSPKTIGRAVKDQRLDAIGIRRVLPHLDEGKEALRSSLTPSLAQALARPHVTHDEDLNQVAWIDDFVERMALESFRGESAMETILGPERTETLHQAAEKQLLQMFQQLNLGNDRASWRLYGEFLGPEKISGLLEKCNVEQWQRFSESSRVSDDELVAAADRVIQALAEKGQQSPIENEKEYYESTIVLDSIVAAITKKAPSESDALLTKIFEAVPDLQPKILERIWTPSCIDSAPPQELNDALRPMSAEEKAMLIWILPSTQSEILDKLIPEGNLKLIISDRIKKLKAKSTPKDVKLASDLCHGFLERLRLQSIKNGWELTNKDETNGANLAAPQPADDKRAA